MAVVLTLERVVHETADRFVSEVTARFHSAVRPIYRVCNDKPDHLGTCTLVKIGGTHWLLTAAHVSDHHQAGSLYVAGEKALVEITDQFFATAAPKGGRTKDHFDFAVAKLGPDTLEALGGVQYIGEENFSRQRYAASTNRLYLCLGYPNSRNKDIRASEKSVRTSLWKYSSWAIAPPLTGDLPKSDDHHLFINFDKKHATDAMGRVTNTI